MRRTYNFSYPQAIIALIVLQMVAYFIMTVTSMTLDTQKSVERAAVATRMAESQMAYVVQEMETNHTADVSETKREGKYKTMIASHTVSGLVTVEVKTFYGDSNRPLARLERVVRP